MNTDWIVVDTQNEPNSLGDYPTLDLSTPEKLLEYLYSIADKDKRVLVIFSASKRIKLRLGIGMSISSVRVYYPENNPIPICAIAESQIADEEVAFSADGTPMYFDADLIMPVEAGIAIVNAICQSGKIPEFIQWRSFA